MFIKVFSTSQWILSCNKYFVMNDSFLPSLKLQNDLNSSSESQFLGRLIRNPGSPRRRKGSRALEEEIGIWSSQGREKDKKIFFFFKPRADDCTTKQLISPKDMFFLKLCTSDYITTMYPA